MYPIGHLKFLLSVYAVLLHNYCSSTGICQPYNLCYNIILMDYFMYLYGTATGYGNCHRLLCI